VLDFADGAVARLTGQYSEVGKQLDSLADLVSFGVAPSAVLFVVCSHSYPLWEGAPIELYHTLRWGVFAVALFSALRLARFNVDEEQREEFTGLPTPAAGLAIVALGSMWIQGDTRLPQELSWLVAGVVSWLLVSPVRMFSLKFRHLSWLGNELRWGFLAAAVVLVATLGVGGVAASVALYTVASVVRNASCARLRKN
jgi:CDP-diacylglycerol--serine O-phosphatidyltransferase